MSARRRLTDADLDELALRLVPRLVRALAEHRVTVEAPWTESSDRAALEPFIRPVLQAAYGMLRVTDRFGPVPLDPCEHPQLEAAIAALPGILLFPGDSPAAVHERQLWDDPALFLREKLDILGRTRQLAAEAGQQEQHRRPALSAG